MYYNNKFENKKCPNNKKVRFQTRLLCSPKNFGGAYSRRLVRPSVSQSVSPSVRPIRVRPITLLFEVGFRNCFTEMTTMLRRRVAHNIWVPTMKVKVTARPCSKIVSGP